MASKKKIPSSFFVRLKHERTRFMSKVGKRIETTRYSVGDTLIVNPVNVRKRRCLILLAKDTAISYYPYNIGKTIAIVPLNVASVYRKFHAKSSKLRYIPTLKEELLPLFNTTVKPELLLQYYPRTLKARIAWLVKHIQRARDAYYSGDTESHLSDPEYDTLMEMLEAIDPDNPELSKTGTQEKPTKSTPSVKLPVPAPSLDKVKPGDGSVSRWVDKMINYTGDPDDPVVLTLKLDGISLLLSYSTKTGKLLKAYTRGDGAVGSDITSKVNFIVSIPKQLPKPRQVYSPIVKLIPAKTVVRGELILRKSVFDKYFAKDYANARNLVASIRTSDNPSKFLLGKVDFVAYSIVTSDLPKRRQLALLKKFKFETPPVMITKLGNVRDAVLTKVDKKFRSSSEYAADGTVVELDNTRLSRRIGTTAKNNPEAARAFKPPTKSVNTKVLGVQWNITKEGFANPVVLLDPVTINDVVVSRAAGKNARWIKRLGIGKGAVVSVVRSGDVIPDIVAVPKPVKAKLPVVCPRCESKLVWVGSKTTNQKTNLKCPNPECPGRVGKQLKHFFVALGVKNVSEKTANILMNNGYDSVDKLLSASMENLIKIPGIGKKKADMILTGLMESLNQSYLYDLMYASGLFGGLLGRRRLRDLCRHFGKRIYMFRGMDKYEIRQEVEQVPGFSEKTADAFAKGIKPFFAFVNSHRLLKNAALRVAPATKKTKLYGKNVVFTGFRDKGLKWRIERMGSDVASNVSKKTDIVVALDPNGYSKKIEKARAYGIPVVSVDDFKNKYDL